MRISYLADAIVPSRKANSIHVMKMCQAYSRLGHDVTLVLPDWRHNIEPGVTDIYKYYGLDQKFQIRKVPFHRFSPLKSVHRSLLMPMVAALGSSDLCHTRSISAAWGLTRLFAKRSILEIHAVPEEQSRLRNMFIDVVRNKNLALLVVLTHALEDHISPLLTDSTPITVAPDGVDSQWLESTVTRQEARRQLGLEKDVRIATYTGHLYPGRGIELILELARLLPDHSFLIVGGRDQDRTAYQRKASSLSNVHFVGFKPPEEVLTYLQAADVLLMPYAPQVGVVRGGKGGDTSSFMSPMKMFEYMAAGRPILASTSQVLQEVLKHEVNSLLLPFDEPLAWRDALKRLAYQPEFANMLAECARTEASQYTWEARARHVLLQASQSKNVRMEAEEPE
jgi:glycosyltransferase involved in cell wall biosynthesis